MGKQTGPPQGKPTGDDLTCKKISDLIVDYVAEELDPETTSAFEEHLSDCPDCVAFFNTYKKTIQVTRSLRYEDVPEEVQNRVRKFLQGKIQGSPRGR